MSKAEAIRWLDSQINDESPKKLCETIAFIKKCVKDYREEPKEEKPKVDLNKYFDTLWKLYPRKINKILAQKTFEHKFRGLTEDECKEKANKIYKLEMQYINDIKANNTEMQYIQHFSSFLNARVPNSPHYKGVR